MSAAPPVRTPDARAILEWVDERIERLEPDEEASTFDRVALRVWRDVRKHLADTLPYVEAGAIVLVDHARGLAMTYPDAFIDLEFWSEPDAAAPIEQQPPEDAPINAAVRRPPGSIPCAHQGDRASAETYDHPWGFICLQPGCGKYVQGPSQREAREQA